MCGAGRQQQVGGAAFIVRATGRTTDRRRRARRARNGQLTRVKKQENETNRAGTAAPLAETKTQIVFFAVVLVEPSPYDCCNKVRTRRGSLFP